MPVDAAAFAQLGQRHARENISGNNSSAPAAGRPRPALS
jgi:hypothetical protein